LASLISSLNIKSEEMPTEKYVQLAWEEILHAEYTMAKLVTLE
jgi:hypothetical protein